MLVTRAVTVAAPSAASVPTVRSLNEKLVYDSPYPNGNSGVRPFASYQRYPTSTPSEYCTVPFSPGHWAAVDAGTWDNDAGNVTVKCPDGSAAPNSSAAIAVPSSWPGYQASSTPLTEESHGMVTAEPVFSTTIVFGFAAATAEIRLSSALPRSMLVRSLPSDSARLTNTTATLDEAASEAAELSDEPLL